MKPVPPGRRFAFTRRDPELRGINEIAKPPSGDLEWQLWDWKVEIYTTQYDTETSSMMGPAARLWLLWVEYPSHRSKPPAKPLPPSGI